MARPPASNVTSAGRDSRSRVNSPSSRGSSSGYTRLKATARARLCCAAPAISAAGRLAPEVGDLPAEVRRRCPDQQRAEFMNLPRRRGHHQDGRIVHRAERLGGVAEENPDRRAGEMFVSGGEGAVAPQVTDGLRQRRDDALQQAQGAQRGGCAFERVVQSVRVERFDGGHALVEERTSCRRFGCSARGASLEAAAIAARACPACPWATARPGQCCGPLGSRPAAG